MIAARASDIFPACSMFARGTNIDSLHRLLRSVCGRAMRQCESPAGSRRANQCTGHNENCGLVRDDGLDIPVISDSRRMSSYMVLNGYGWHLSC